MGDSIKYSGLISVLQNNNVDVNDILEILSEFTGATNVSLFTKTGRLISTNEKLNDVSKFERTRFVVGLDILYSDVKSINPFLNAIEGILDDDIDGTSFIVNMSHEIRTPLNGVNGYIQLLSQSSLRKDQRSMLNSMTNCSVQLMEIINNVLDASRLNSCKMGINESVFSLKEVETTTMNVVSERTKANKQTLRWRGGSNLPDYIVSDKQKLIQIMINLISNASKYSKEGSSIQVVMSCENSTLKIQVIDDGIGIPESKQHLLFSPFSQLHPESVAKGSGLGLSICKRLALLLKGDLTAVSKEGKGSVFTLTMKYDEPSDMTEVIDINIDKLIGINVYIVSEKVSTRLKLLEHFETWSANTKAFATVEEVKHCSTREANFVDIILVESSVEADAVEEIRVCYPLANFIIIGENDQGVCCDDVIEYPLCKAQIYGKVVTIVENNSRRTPAKEDTKIHTSARILVCEDVEYNRDILAHLLNDIGVYNIDFAFNGEEAIEKIQSTPYDLIFLDLKMPKVDGYAVIDYIKKNKLKLPKIIVTTASVISGEFERCSEMGVDCFLSKPVSLTDLRRVVVQNLLV